MSWLSVIAIFCIVSFLTGIIVIGLKEADDLKVENLVLSLPKLPTGLKGIKIAFLSDFHIRPNGFGLKLAKRAISSVNESDPDLVFLGGDLVQWCEGLPVLIPILSEIKSRYGVFAVLGNHDHHCPWRSQRPAPWASKPLSVEEWRTMLGKANAVLLVNESVCLSVKGTSFWLAGVDDAYTNRANLKVTLEQVPEDGFVILISHSPDILDDPLIYRVALVLSGHTHGGQILLPILGPLLAPCRDRYRRAKGLIRFNNTWLYVSKGVLAGIPLRFRCPPDVTILTLT